MVANLCQDHEGFDEYFTKGTAALARLKIYQKDKSKIGHIEIRKCPKCRKKYLIDHKETKDAKSN